MFGIKILYKLYICVCVYGGGGNAQICNHKAGARTVNSALQSAAELQRQFDMKDTDLHKMAKWLP
jgi:hypothetical protein